jgi:hypothetical protein
MNLSKTPRKRPRRDYRRENERTLLLYPRGKTVVFLGEEAGVVVGHELCELSRPDDSGYSMHLEVVFRNRYGYMGQFTPRSRHWWPKPEAFEKETS